MIRIGIDLVEIARLDAALARWPRLADRLFTAGERAYAAERADPGQHLAARFAAKEATMKALGTGWPQIGWHDVEVGSEGERPALLLSGRAAELASGAEVAVSLAHDGGFAVAQVLVADP
ncbi:MAG: holo-ACP synthase [Actinomycetota bacterium]